MLDDINYQEKINTFKILVGNEDDDIALRYLEREEWDEQKAAMLYNSENKTLPQKYSPETGRKNYSSSSNEAPNVRGLPDFPLILPLPGAFQVIGSWFSSIIYDPLRFQSKFKRFKNVVTNYQSFTIQVKTRVGIVIIYNANTVNQTFGLLNEISRDNFTNEVFFGGKNVIFPTLDESKEGKGICLRMSVKIFPTFFILKYKRKDLCGIVERFDGGIDYSRLRDAILSASSISDHPETNHSNNIINSTKEDIDFKEIVPFIEDPNINMNKEIQGSSNAAIIAEQNRELKELERLEKIRELKEKEKEKREKEEEEKRKIEEERQREESEKKKESLPPEPSETDPNKSIIVFRYPDGERTKERRFLKTDKIKLLHTFVQSLGREIFTEDEAKGFELIQPFPRKIYDNMENTLEQEGLFPNAVLQIKEITE